MNTPEEANALFNANTKLAGWYASKYRGLDQYEDLHQVALMGLWKACQTWNPAIAKLSVHAKFQMRSAMQAHLRRCGVMRGSGNGHPVQRTVQLNDLAEGDDGLLVETNSNNRESRTWKRAMRRDCGRRLHRGPSLDETEGNREAI